MMRLLLDTHALIWALEGGARLSEMARASIEDGENDILVSAVSAWEIEIKKALGRLEAPDDLLEAVDEMGFTKKDLGFSTARRLQKLPLLHKDPFDRMLIATALEEGVPLVSRDRKIAQYDVKLFW